MEEKVITPEEFELAKITVQQYLVQNSETNLDEYFAFIEQNGVATVLEYEHVPDSNVLRVIRWQITHEKGTIIKRIRYQNLSNSPSFLAVKNITYVKK